MTEDEALPQGVYFTDIADLQRFGFIETQYINISDSLNIYDFSVYSE